MLVELDRRQAVARNKEAGRNRVQKVVGGHLHEVYWEMALCKAAATAQPLSICCLYALLACLMR